MNLRRALRHVRWYLRELTGEAQYDHYLERHRSRHPEAPTLSRRDFERCRTDRLDANPGQRCC